MAPHPSHNITLFELIFNVKFPLLRLLQFLSDSKSTIVSIFIFVLLILNKRQRRVTLVPQIICNETANNHSFGSGLFGYGSN